MPAAYKRVPAVDKCFAVMDLFAKTEKPLGISEISRQLALNKSTVFNLVYTLTDLDVLEEVDHNKFGFGYRFYALANAAGKRSELIHIVRPYLERINRETKLSAFLGVRSELRSVLIDKVDSAYNIRISSEIGMQMPLLAGAGIKAMLSLLTENEVEDLLGGVQFKKYTPNSIVEKSAYISEINDVRHQGIAYDREEYIEGMMAAAVPIKAPGRRIQAAIWAVGLTHQISGETLPKLNGVLTRVAEEINQRLLM